MDAIFHVLATNLYAKDERWRDEALVFMVLPDLGFLLMIVYLFVYLPKDLTVVEAFALMPQWLIVLYYSLHSIVVLAIAAAVAWWLRPKLLLAMSAWLFHIVIDIPVHRGSYATRVFYPLLPEASIQGTTWGDPVVLVGGYSLLLAGYAYMSWREKRKHYLREKWRADWVDKLGARANDLINRRRVPAVDAERQDIDGTVN